MNTILLHILNLWGEQMDKLGWVDDENKDTTVTCFLLKVKQI